MNDEDDKSVKPAPEEKTNEKESETKASEKPTTKKKGVVGKVFKWLFIALGVVFLVVIFYLGWLGFIPGLSTLLGANNPRDLGVQYTQADLDSFYVKTDSKELDHANAPVDPNDPNHKFHMLDAKPMSDVYTQEEVTARINETAWVYMPFTNVQVRFGENNRIEVSGTVITEKLDYFINLLGGVGYSEEDVQTGINWLSRMAGDPAVYIDATGSITNNQLDLTINNVQIGRWNAPLGEASKVLTTATENALSRTRGLDVKSATFSPAGINFVGSGPSTIYVEQ